MMANDATAQAVTADDVECLLTWKCMEPTLVRWTDTGEVDVLPGVLFGDISFADRYRAHEVLATAEELRGQGDWDTENPTQADFEAFAEMLNDAG